MTDHAHIYDNGHCTTCYEREDAVVVKLDFLRDRTVEAIDLARRTIAQLQQDDADDALMRAEYHARVQELRAERDSLGPGAA